MLCRFCRARSNYHCPYYLGQLREIRLNIKNQMGCQGKDLKIRITQSSNTCETQMKGRFGRGDTLVWKADDYSYGQWATGELGDCQDFDFDHNAQFNLVYSGRGRGNSRYCPSLIEFLTRSEDSDFLDSWKHLKLKSTENKKWFSARENNKPFYAIPT